MSDADWPEDAVVRLRTLWAEGHSTAEIARRMNRTKNAVVGKAHRIFLPPRPSPIKNDPNAPPKPAQPRRVTGPTLPPLATSSAPAVIPPPPPPPAPTRGRAPLPTGFAFKPTRCAWPIGEPGSKSFRFCDGTATDGRPYCPEHCGKAYVKIEPARNRA